MAKCTAHNEEACQECGPLDNANAQTFFDTLFDVINPDESGEDDPEHWQTRDGRKVQIGTMHDDHLVNVALFLERSQWLRRRRPRSQAAIFEEVKMRGLDDAMEAGRKRKLEADRIDEMFRVAVANMWGAGVSPVSRLTAAQREALESRWRPFPRRPVHFKLPKLKSRTQLAYEKLHATPMGWWQGEVVLGVILRFFDWVIAFMDPDNARWRMLEID